MPELQNCELHKVKWNPQTIDECPECFAGKEDKKDKMMFARSAHYRELVRKKDNDDTNLNQQHQWLLEQIYFLRKAVAFLESRKRELENGVGDLEKIINIGVTVVERIEDSERLNKSVELLENERNKSKDVKKIDSGGSKANA